MRAYATLAAMFASAALTFGCGPSAPSPAPTAPIEASPDVAPPMVDGLYVAQGSCPFETCTLGAWIATGQTDLFERADVASTRIGIVENGEHVMATESFSLLTPQRGLVLTTGGDFVAGDVIYVLDGMGEGFSAVWRRGQFLQLFVLSEDPQFRWDNPPDQWDDRLGPNEGWWVRIQRANGQAGWALNPSRFDCMRMNDRSSACSATP